MPAVRSVLLCVLLSLAWQPAQAANASEQSPVERLNEATANLYGSLKSFVCDERIERFKSALDGNRARRIDVVTAALSFENGTEDYTAIRQNSVRRSSMGSLSGAWSEGEFGSLVRQTNQLLRVKSASYLGTNSPDGVQVARFAFDVAAGESPWQLVVASREYRVPFQTEIWVSSETGQIVRISRRSLSLPAATGISDIVWSVTLRPTRLQDDIWILPATAEYYVSYAQKNRREWNRMTFDHYRRYGAEVALRFGN